MTLPPPPHNDSVMHGPTHRLSPFPRTQLRAPLLLLGSLSSLTLLGCSGNHCIYSLGHDAALLEIPLLSSAPSGWELLERGKHPKGHPDSIQL